jgi:hypothetical protein
MDTGPSDGELREFVGSMLSNLDQHLREPAVIDEAIRERREMWVMLFRVSSGFDRHDSPSPGPGEHG